MHRRSRAKFSERIERSTKRTENEAEVKKAKEALEAPQLQDVPVRTVQIRRFSVFVWVSLEELLKMIQLDLAFSKLC